MNIVRQTINQKIITINTKQNTQGIQKTATPVTLLEQCTVGSTTSNTMS